MRRFLYRLYLQLVKLSMEARQRAYMLYLSRRRDRLEGADLSYLYLAGARLRGANLYGANLRHADLRRADLRDANLLEADLRRANLTGAQVDTLQLRLAASLEGAILPNGERYQDDDERDDDG